MTTEWTWDEFLGDQTALKFARKELPTLDAVISLTPRRGMAVQAGGNLGVFPKRLADAFTRVITFEPDRELYACLRHNAPNANILAFQMALGADDGVAGLSRERRDASGRPSHAGLTHLVPGDDVRVVPLDDLNIGSCDLLYLDIEGYEFHALMGARKTIRKYLPVVVASTNHITHYHACRADIAAMLALSGYRSHLIIGADEIFVPPTWSDR